MKILITEEEIQSIVNELAQQISHDYAEKKLLIIGVLKGAYAFLADLARAITIPCEIEFVRVSSYRDDAESGTLELLQDIAQPIEEYDVLIVEDILDSGRTLSAMIKHFGSKNPQSVAACTLLDKPARRQVPVKANYIGREIPDLFVVGYGLDFAQRYRNLPYIGVIELE